MELNPVGGLRGKGLVPVARAPAHNVPPSMAETTRKPGGDGTRHVVLMEMMPSPFRREDEASRMVLERGCSVKGAGGDPENASWGP
eukprot:739962-Alexandrium_andersonii.AAC.1